MEEFLSEKQLENYAYFQSILEKYDADILFQMKHLIIHNQKVCGIFDTFEAALAQAVHTFPQGEFIIQQVISDNAIVGFFYTSPWTDEERKDIRQVLEEIVADGEVDLSQFY